jgi:hypothetical protein
VTLFFGTIQATHTTTKATLPRSTTISPLLLAVVAARRSLILLLTPRLVLMRLPLLLIRCAVLSRSTVTVSASLAVLRNGRLTTRAARKGR